MVKNIEEAKEIAIKSRPNMKIIKAIELEKCYVITMVPNDYSVNDDVYIGGSTRVDKKTGLVQLYNPLLESIR